MAVVVLDRALDLRLAGEAQLDLELALQVRAQLVERDDVVGVGERDDELLLLAVERHREDAVAARHVARQQLERRRIDDDAREVDRLQAELLGQRVAQRRFGDEAELHQQPPDRHVLLGLLEQRDAQLVLGEDPLVDQDLAEVALGLRDWRANSGGSAPVLLSSPSCARRAAARGGEVEARAALLGERDRALVVVERELAAGAGGRG